MFNIIAAVGLFNGEGPAEVSGTVKDRIKPIMSTAWKFWPLVHCCTYSVKRVEVASYFQQRPFALNKSWGLFFTRLLAVVGKM